MKADCILYNGKIHTLDPKTPLVSSVAILGNCVAAVGDDSLQSQFDGYREKIDLQQKTIIPGLVDAHAHLQSYAESLHNVDLNNTSSAQETVDRLHAYFVQNPGTRWIQGWGWCQDDWPDKSFPTASLIDRVLPNVPVTVTARSGHTTWSNSLAFARAGINANTPNPAGGEIKRDAQGQPTGVLSDEAIKLVQKIIPPLPVHELVEEMEIAIRSMIAMGVAGFHDFDGAESFKALQELHAQGRLSFRVTKQILVEFLEDAIRIGLRTGFGDDFLRIGAIKIFADGALGSRTASTFETYEGEPGNLGLVVTEKEEMIHQASQATLAGLTCAIHAIGDRAVHDVLDAYEVVRKSEKEAGISIENRRHRIEHVQLIHPDDAPRLKKLGIIASMQPIHAPSDMYMADLHWGERAAKSYNWRSQLKYGTTLVLGSDAPVESPNPFLGIHAAVTRRRLDGSPGPMGWRSENNGRLTVREALQGYTVGPAYAAGREHELGRLLTGFLADLLVLNQDIFSIDPMVIPETRPLAVMIGGNWMVNNL